MPRVVSRLPRSLHPPVAIALAVLALLALVAALILFAIYSRTTETSGHLWWAETREIPLEERRPYQFAALGCFAFAGIALAGFLELVVAIAVQWRIDRQRTREELEARRLWVMSPEGQAALQAQAAEAQRQAARAAAEREARDSARRRAEWERTLAGRATLAYQRGDNYFSVELIVDGDLAAYLNDIARAGWRQESFSRRHERTTVSTPQYTGGPCASG